MERPLGTSNHSLLRQYERDFARGVLNRGYIDGLILSNDTTDATNDIAISAGVCRSTVNIVQSNPSTLDRNQVDIEIPVGIIKQLDTAWAPENFDPEGFSGGDRSGGRSTSSLSNTTWHVYAIGGPGVPGDIMFHDSATTSSVAAALPTNYTAFRRIGSILRESAAIVGFTQRGDDFERATIVSDYSQLNPGTSAVTNTLSIPIGIVVQANLIFGLAFGGTTTTTYGLCTALTATDETPSSTKSHLSGANANAGNVGVPVIPMLVWTNTSAQVRTRISFSDANITMGVRTRGWRDTRGRDA